jgi:hypothetical protein
VRWRGRLGDDDVSATNVSPLHDDGHHPGAPNDESGVIFEGNVAQ